MRGFDLCIISETKGLQDNTKVWAAVSTLLGQRGSTQKSFSKAKALQVDAHIQDGYKLTDQTSYSMAVIPLLCINTDSEPIKIFFFIRNKLCLIFKAPES